MSFKFFQRVSQAPTKPQAAAAPKQFDVADLYSGPAATGSRPGGRGCARARRKTPPGVFLDRQQRDHQPVLRHRVSRRARRQPYVLGDQHCAVTLPSGQSYSSFVLLPLLNFAVRRKCLFIGGPGRGKTASADPDGRARRLLAPRSPARHPERPAADDHLRPARHSASRPTSSAPRASTRSASPGANGSACASRSSTNTTASRRARSRRCSPSWPTTTPRCSTRPSSARSRPGTSPPTTTPAAAPIRSSKR